MRVAAAEALAAGHGGVTAVSRITGVARSTIDRGLAELRGDAAPVAAPERVRRKGGGRRPLVVTDSSLLADLKELVEPTTRGDPMAPLLWTAKSLRTLAAGLGELGHRVCHNVVADLLRAMGYSLQANRKTLEGTSHPDRDAQFGYLNAQVKEALAAGEPAISGRRRLRPRSTPRRRSWSAISRMAGVSTAPRVSPNRFGCTIS
jgi:Rhodopirellula transposase DDE domain